MTFELRELSASPEDRERLAAFHAGIYTQQFPDPDERESLPNIVRYLELKEQGWYGRNNYHVVLAYRDESIVGACILDYLDEPNAGVIEFLVIVPQARGGGIGHALLAEAERLARADASRGGRTLQWIAAEMNDPFIVPDVPDNMDPFVRARIWGGWGFGALDCPYVQPALSDDQKPADGLVLIAKCLEPLWRDGVPSAQVRALVAAYMQWAMRIETPAANAQFQALATWLAPRATVRRVPLVSYIGEFAAADDSPNAFDVIEVQDDRAPEFAAATAVYDRAFASPATTLRGSTFASVLRNAPDAGYRYHFWAVRGRRSGAIAGMASFFGFAGIGFGGYVVLDGPLNGVGALRPLLARIEQRLVADDLGIRGWLIECESEHNAAVFARCGFRALAVPYTQPELPGARIGGTLPLTLMYRQLGRCYAAPQLAATTFLAGLADVLRWVYDVRQPRAHPTLQVVTASLAGRSTVPFAHG